VQAPSVLGCARGVTQLSPVLSPVLPIRSLPKVKRYCHKILPNNSTLIKAACNLVMETTFSTQLLWFSQVGEPGILTEDEVCPAVA